MAGNRKRGSVKPSTKGKAAGRKKPTGRPALYPTAESMQERIDLYFAGIDESNPPTVSGLALFLGFCDRQSMYSYKNRNEDFANTVKKAITRISDYAEKVLLNGKVSHTGAIFWLKNHRWSDEIKSEVKTTVVVKSSSEMTKELEEGEES